MYHESEFVRDDNKEPMWGGFSGRYSACRAQEPDMGSRVCGFGDVVGFDI